MTPGHNIGAGRLRSFFERWQRLEADKQAIAEDLKELFAEAKGEGWNTKAMRAVFRDKAKLEAEDISGKADREEFEALCDLYRDALDGPRAHPAPARVENIEEFPPHDAETGELAEQKSDGGAIGAVKAQGRLPDADSVEPPPSDDDIPAFVRKQYVLRPHCLHPDNCAGYSDKHCHECTKARAQSEAA